MTILDWFGRSSEDDELDADDLEWEDRPVEPTRLEFIRRTVRFMFVRGGDDTITYDEWSYPNDHRTHGKEESRRGDVRVEKFYQITGGSVASTGGEVIVHIGRNVTDTRELVGEVTTANVASRKVLEEKEMVVEVPTVQAFGLHPETGEVVRKGWHKRDRDGTVQIKEADD